MTSRTGRTLKVITRITYEKNSLVVMKRYQIYEEECESMCAYMYA